MQVTLGNHPEMNPILDELHKVYEGLGCDVIRLPSKTPDSVFHRDVFAATPHGLIKCRMANASRTWEPDTWFDQMGLTPKFEVKPPGTFEGADLFWCPDDSIVIGIGSRTNEHGYSQLVDYLHPLDVTRIDLPVWHDQHLLGVWNMVGNKRLTVIDPATLPLCEYLSKCTNFVQVGSIVVMPAGCPQTERTLRKLATVVVVPIGQLLRYGGGVACATGILNPYEKSPSDCQGFEGCDDSL